MINFDLRSFTFMAGLLGVLMGVIILILRRHHSTINGMVPWGLAPLFGASSTLFYGLDGLLPNFIVSLVGGILLLVGFGLFYIGTERFYGQPSTWHLWAGLGCLCLAGRAYFLWIDPDYRWRVLLLTGFMAVMVFTHIQLLLYKEQTFGSRLTIAALILQGLVLLVRAATTLWLDTATTNRFEPSVIQTIYIAGYSFSALLLGVGVLLMVSERVRQQFEYIATHDNLTGTLMRSVVLQAAEKQLIHFQNSGQLFSLLILDIDYFKRINDTYGHLVGDQVLIHFADVVDKALQKSSVLGRFGGEEFIVLLPSTPLAAAIAIAERVCEAVKQQPPTGLPTCTVSIGVATIQPDDAHISALLGRADACLYRAKAQGRNRVEADHSTPNLYPQPVG